MTWHHLTGFSSDPESLCECRNISVKFHTETLLFRQEFPLLLLFLFYVCLYVNKMHYILILKINFHASALILTFMSFIVRRHCSRWPWALLLEHRWQWKLSCKSGVVQNGFDSTRTTYLHQNSRTAREKFCTEGHCSLWLSQAHFVMLTSPCVNFDITPF